MLEAYFDAHIAPFLSPMIIGKQQPFPFLANKQLYAVVLLTTQKGKKKTGIVPCSNSVFKRLIEIPTRPGTFMLSEELILHFVSKLYPKYVIREKSIMRVTRNADIDAQSMYDEDMDYRNMMEELIKKRVRLDPVRVELSRKINRKAIDELSSFLEIGKKHFISVKHRLICHSYSSFSTICETSRSFSLRSVHRVTHLSFRLRRVYSVRLRKGCASFISV